MYFRCDKFPISLLLPLDLHIQWGLLFVTKWLWDRNASLAWQPIHPRKEGLASLVQWYTLGRVNTHKRKKTHHKCVKLDSTWMLSRGRLLLKDIWSRWGRSYAIWLEQKMNYECQIHTHEQCMSENRPSFCGVEGWHARLGRGSLWRHFLSSVLTFFSSQVHVATT